MITVTVHYFAALRERRGLETESMQTSETTTIGRLYAQIFPPGPDGALPVAYAQNHVRVPGATPLADGDEVAFLPPLGGG